jgi:hypothetical protein
MTTHLVCALFVAAASVVAQQAAAPAQRGAASPGAAAKAQQREARKQWAVANADWVAAHDRAIAWLAAQQAPDGSLAPRGSGGRDAACVAATAAALLAFGSAPSTMKGGSRMGEVRRAVDWLVDLQRRDGWYLDPALPDAPLAHSLAALAVARTCAASDHAGYRRVTVAALEPVASGGVAALGEPLPRALYALAARALDVAAERQLAHLSALLATNGLCTREAGSLRWTGVSVGTHELATVAIVLACRGTPVLTDQDARWPAVRARVRALPTRVGAAAELLDALSLWWGADVAVALGGETWAAHEALLRAHVIPRLAAGGEGSVAFRCGAELLRNEIAETAFAALALAAPWSRVGR